MFGFCYVVRLLDPFPCLPCKQSALICRGHVHSLRPQQIAYILPGKEYKPSDLQRIYELANAQASDSSIMQDAWEVTTMKFILAQYTLLETAVCIVSRGECNHVSLQGPSSNAVGQALLLWVVLARVAHQGHKLPSASVSMQWHFCMHRSSINRCRKYT